MKIVICLVTVLFLAGCAGHAQTNLYHKPGTKIDRKAAATVVSDQTGALSDMTFLDILSTELLGRGMNIVDRSTLQGILKDKGLNLTEIISGQQYFKIGEASPVKTIIVVNGSMIGTIVERATCRVLNAEDGSLLLSMTIANPAPANPMYIGNRGTSRIIEEWADEIAGYGYR